jgi:hypothetical protein
MKSIDKFLMVEIFVRHAHPMPWVRVRGTNLLILTGKGSNYQDENLGRFYLVKDKSSLYNSNSRCNFDKLLLRKNKAGSVHERNSRRGGYILSPIDDIINALPEELKMTFIFNIDLFR